MGYTHYFNFKKGTEEFPVKFVEDVKKVLEGKEQYIQLEFDEYNPHTRDFSRELGLFFCCMDI